MLRPVLISGRMFTAIAVLISGASIVLADERCPSGLEGNVEVFDCKCYQFTTKVDSWDNIKCSSNDGRLATVNSSAVNEWLKSTLREQYPGEDHGFWIGGSRSTAESDWRWTDGTPVRFSNWADGEPDHLEFGIGRIEQNCIYMKADKRFRWSSLQCSTAWDIPSICQYDIPDCVTTVPEDKISTAILIGIVVGAVVGGLLLCLLICCIIVRCKNACVKYQKKKQRQRSVRYYSRPASLAGPQRPGGGEGRCQVDSGGDHEEGENDLNEQLMTASRAEAGTSNALNPPRNPLDDDGEVLNVKGPLPTADSIALEIKAQKGLLVDVNTGRATIKRINEPSTSQTADNIKPATSKSRADNASTRSLKSFNLDGERSGHDDQVSNQLSQLSHEEDKLSLSDSQSSVEDNSVLITSNLDNVDKPSSHPSKDLYK